MSLADYLNAFALACACVGGIFALATWLGIRRTEKRIKRESSSDTGANR